MRKFTFAAMALFFLLGFVLKASEARAVEAKLGVAMMYDWWSPAFLKLEQENAAKIFSSNLRDNQDGSFMLGPTFWVRLTGDWAMVGTVLFGVTRNQFDHTSVAIDMPVWALVTPGGPVDSYLDVGSSKVRRYDVDLNFEYAIHKYFNLLIGARFNYDDGEGIQSFRLLENPLGLGGARFNLKDEYYDAWYLGPSLGIGFHIEPVENFTISLGVSAIVQWGDYYLEKKFLIPPITYAAPYKYDVGYFCIGLDTNLKFAYLIAPINVELWIGGRYMLLPHISAGDDGSVLDLSYKQGWITGELEHFGGITFGAAYKF
jgi:hypothetical protein